MNISVKTSCGNYEITLQRGILKNSGKFLNLERKVLIITDDGIPDIYVSTLKKQCKSVFVITLKQGEASKSFKNYQKILKNMVDFSFDRNDCVVALGGGVIGDLAGFVASSYMRGIDFYNIPTTLLSQVDSSIGGKVAINFSGYKNIIGAFYPPKAVIIDPDVLKTLPIRHINNGLAECVKMSLTSDEELFELFENANIYENIDLIIERSLTIKKYVVENDEKEKGLRKILNFGHTVGHAIESSTDMKEWYHGECVAAGMLLTCSSDVKARLVKVLNKINLPTYIPCSKLKMGNAITHDKKMNGLNISEIFVEKPGSFIIKDLSIEEVKLMIREGYKQCEIH